jgi:GNAT superfamily N-acetyltransferase
VEVRHVGLDDAAAQAVLVGLASEYDARYGENDEMLQTEPREFVAPAGTFVVVVADDGSTIAGGGLRPVAEGSCEVKRMWVAAEHRREGLASLVLSTLEDTARATGYETIILETGPRQPEAHALYRRGATSSGRATAGTTRPPPTRSG